MKKLTSLLLGCSLALAGTVLAQKPDEQASPKPTAAVEKGKGHAPEAKPKAQAAESKPAASTKPATTSTTTAPTDKHADKHGGKSAVAAPTEKAAAPESSHVKAPTDPATSTAAGVDKHAG